MAERLSATTALLAIPILILSMVLAACTPTPPATPTSAPAASQANTQATSSGTAPPPTREPLPTQGPLPTAAATAVAAATPTAAPAGKQGGSMVAATTSDAVTFHPYLRTDSASGAYQGLVYGGDLLTYDPQTLEKRPEMATSWTISDDKLTYTYILRDDLVWSDGVPMTSADWKWTYDQAIKPENKYPYISNLKPIASYEAPDPKTIVVKLKDPLVVGLETADAIVPLPKHVWENLDWNDPQQNPQILAPTVGSGPFILKEWQKDNRAVFVANDRYYRGRPLIDTFTYKIVPSSEIAYQMLKNGEVDYAGFTPENYPDAKKLPNVTVYEWWPAAAQWSYLGFNLRQPTLQDRDVRRALSYAINREDIARYVFNDLARPTYSAYTPSSWVYNPDVPRYDYDVEKAKSMLDAAGWKVGSGGIRQKDGQPLKLRLVYGPNTSKTAERVSTVAQQAWNDVGAQVEVQGFEWGTFLGQIHSDSTDWDVYFGTWGSTIEPHWMNQIWREESIPQLNSVAYVNKHVEDLFDQGVREFDREKRKAIYQEIQSILSTDAPYVFLTFNLSYVGINNRIDGIEPTAIGIGYNRERWYIK